MRISISLDRPTAVTPTPHVARVAGMFGLGLDEERTLTIVPPTVLDLRPGQVVFITGPSGSGKSSILRLIAAAAAERVGGRVIWFDGGEESFQHRGHGGHREEGSEGLGIGTAIGNWKSAIGNLSPVPSVSSVNSVVNSPPSLVDSFPGLSLEEALHYLSLAGLSDAFVLLRREGELSGYRQMLWMAA